MKGLIIVIVLLAILGIWWAKRGPEPVTNVETGASALNGASDLYGNGAGNNSTDNTNQSDNGNGSEYEDKG